MAIYHLSLKFVSRGQGRSSVGASAYRSGEKLYNNYDGLTHDYSGRKGVVYSEILLPDQAPKEFLDRQTLWNAVEEVEKRKDARTAKEVEIALPNELTRDEQIQLVREFVASNFLSEGLCADIAIHTGKHEHEKDVLSEESKNDKMIVSDNPHAHILLTDRPVNENGFLQKKNAQLNKKEYLQKWRENFADIQNREFERKGLEVRVSHESHINRGIDREPTKHLGYAVAEMERRGIATDRGNENRAIIARNKAKDEREHRRELERRQNRKPNREEVPSMGERSHRQEAPHRLQGDNIIFEQPHTPDKTDTPYTKGSRPNIDIFGYGYAPDNRTDKKQPDKQLVKQPSIQEPQTQEQQESEEERRRRNRMEWERRRQIQLSEEEKNKEKERAERQERREREREDNRTPDRSSEISR